MSRRLGMLALLAALLVARPSRGRVGAVATRAQAIVGGLRDDGHSAVVAIAIDAAGPGGLCSGVVLGPRLVLTAAHCAAGRRPDELEVLLGAETGAPEARLAVEAIELSPGATGTAEDYAGGVDLAALRLATDAPVSALPLELQAEAGATVVVVGYGASDGSGVGSGLRRSAELRVVEACDRVLRVGDAVVDACVGDSGGAVLSGGRVLAITSAGPAGCNAPTTVTRLGPHAQWLNALLAGRWGVACADCPRPDATCRAPDPGDAGGCAIAPGRRAR